jgi:hypothetical protein
MTTPNYAFHLSTDLDPMSDVNASLNNNWTKVENVPEQEVVATLPAFDFSYAVGARIYHSGYRSTFVLLGRNSFWGNFWRPIQARYSPWIQPNTILVDPINYQFGATPVQYRISNQGKFILRGSIDRVAGTYPDYGATGTALNLLQSLAPDVGAGITPPMTSDFPLTPYQINTPTVNPQIAMMSIVASGTSFMRVWNPNAVITQLFFDNVEWTFGANIV